MIYDILKCKVILKKDIYFRDAFSKIAHYVYWTLSQNDKFREFHKEKYIKHYVISNFYKPEIDKIYKKDKIYHFEIRSIDRGLINYLQNNLKKNINNPDFLVIDTEFRYKKQKFIKEIISLTPTIITLPNGRFWTMKESGDIILLQKQLTINLLKKYALDKYKEYECDNFIEMIEILNHKPQTITIKNNIKLFGNLFKIVPKSDSFSQNLAFYALGVGLGEKNTYGGGFCREMNNDEEDKI